MTLHNDRKRPERPAMSKRTLVILIAVVVVIFVFVAVTLAVSGQSFF
jgi:flagellar basal body-associated protein FliL